MRLENREFPGYHELHACVGAYTDTHTHTFQFLLLFLSLSPFRSLSLALSLFFDSLLIFFRQLSIMHAYAPESSFPPTLGGNLSIYIYMCFMRDEWNRRRRIQEGNQPRRNPHWSQIGKWRRKCSRITRFPPTKESWNK